MGGNATTCNDVEAIKKVDEEFFAATNAGDLERRMATMSPDTIIMPPDQISIVGREEIRRLSQAYEAAFEEKCILTFDEIEAAGDWGFVRANVTATRITKADGKVEHVSLKNLWIMRKQADGEWKF